MLLASAPPPGTPVPAAMRAVAGGTVTLVWKNEVGGLTGRVAGFDGAPPRFVKWNLVSSGESLAAEAERLRWLAGRHPAPVVLEFASDGDTELLVSAELPGRSAVDPLWADRVDDAVRAIAEGLRRLHSLPTSECPFEWDVAARIAVATASGLVIPPVLREPPQIDRLVVCHGDPCAPNTLLGPDGFTANVDFGRLGLADRWADLAVATMSLGWNYENFDESVFWDTYGVEPDPERISYYRALWTAT